MKELGPRAREFADKVKRGDSGIDWGAEYRKWHPGASDAEVADYLARTEPRHLEPCGCLRNDAGAHRVGCPAHPEGVRGRD